MTGDKKNPIQNLFQYYFYKCTSLSRFYNVCTEPHNYLKNKPSCSYMEAFLLSIQSLWFAFHIRNLYHECRRQE